MSVCNVPVPCQLAQWCGNPCKTCELCTSTTVAHEKAPPTNDNHETIVVEGDK